MLTAALLVSLLALAADLILPAPSSTPEFLRTLAGIGASFFLAYVIEATWLASRFERGPRHEPFLGLITGLAVFGLLGVGSILVISDRHDSGQLRGSHVFWFWFSVTSLGCLGLLVALQPVLTHTWLHERPKSDSGVEVGAADRDGPDDGHSLGQTVVVDVAEGEAGGADG